jgi:hypothetical protein
LDDRARKGKILRAEGAAAGIELKEFNRRLDFPRKRLNAHLSHQYLRDTGIGGQAPDDFPQDPAFIEDPQESTDDNKEGADNKNVQRDPYGLHGIA